MIDDIISAAIYSTRLLSLVAAVLKCGSPRQLMAGHLKTAWNEDLFEHSVIMLE